MVGNFDKSWFKIGKLLGDRMIKQDNNRADKKMLYTDNKVSIALNINISDWLQLEQNI